MPTSSDRDFKHDALFDMQFEKRRDIVAPGLLEPVGIAADAAQAHRATSRRRAR